MAWDSDPEIAALRDYGEKFGRPIVVAFSLEAGSSKYHIATYGKTRKLCSIASDLGTQIEKAISDGTIAPRTERRTHEP